MSAKASETLETTVTKSPVMTVWIAFESPFIIKILYNGITGIVLEFYR